MPINPKRHVLLGLVEGVCPHFVSQCMGELDLAVVDVVFCQKTGGIKMLGGGRAQFLSLFYIPPILLTFLQG